MATINDYQSKIIKAFKDDLSNDNFDRLYKYISDDSDGMSNFTNIFLDCGIQVEELLSGITIIRDGMFYFRQLRKVNIPDTIKTIEDSGFAYCDFDELIISNPNIDLQRGCLYRCSIKNIVLPKKFQNESDLYSELLIDYLEIKSLKYPIKFV